MITENKLRHSLAVAEKARELAESLIPNSNIDKPAMLDAIFITGLLHDVGYDKLSTDDSPSTHPAIGARMLQHFLQYQYTAARAIKEHGHSACDNLISYVLNAADLSVDSHGNPVDMDLRVLDIYRKYPGSAHADSAMKQLEAVKHADTKQFRI